MIPCEGVHPNDSGFRGGRSVQLAAHDLDLVETPNLFWNLCAVELMERLNCDFREYAKRGVNVTLVVKRGITIVGNPIIAAAIAGVRWRESIRNSFHRRRTRGHWKRRSYERQRIEI